jgi:hypothetical protein
MPLSCQISIGALGWPTVARFMHDRWAEALQCVLLIGSMSKSDTNPGSRIDQHVEVEDTRAMWWTMWGSSVAYIFYLDDAPFHNSFQYHCEDNSTHSCHHIFIANGHKHLSIISWITKER